MGFQKWLNAWSFPQSWQSQCQSLNGRNDYSNQNTLQSPPSKQATLIVWLLWCMDCLNEVICHWVSEKSISNRANGKSVCMGVHPNIWKFCTKLLYSWCCFFKPKFWYPFFLLALARRSDPAPFFGVVSESARWVAGDADDTELFGGLYDWLPKFSLFSLASASSLSKAAVWHCSTVDANNLQNWQQQESKSKRMMHERYFEATSSGMNVYSLVLGNVKNE